MLYADTKPKISCLWITGIIQGQEDFERAYVDDIDGGVHHAQFLAGAQHYVYLLGRILVGKLRIS